MNRIVPVLCLCISLFKHSAGAQTDGFEELHALISPETGEARWMEIDWYPTVWEGWKVAAAEGKPIFFMAGSGGAPCAGC